jgi:hypothetical protein
MLGGAARLMRRPNADRAHVGMKIEDYTLTPAHAVALEIQEDHLPVAEEQFEAYVVALTLLPGISGRGYVRALGEVGFALGRQKGVT